MGRVKYKGMISYDSHLQVSSSKKVMDAIE